MMKDITIVLPRIVAIDFLDKARRGVPDMLGMQEICSQIKLQITKQEENFRDPQNLPRVQSSLQQRQESEQEEPNQVPGPEAA